MESNVVQSKRMLELLIMHKKVDLVVEGSSMCPTINDKDVVLVERNADYAIADIVLFFYKGSFVVHRLIKKENDRYFCKGDNSFRLEDVYLKDIIGKIVSVNGMPVKTVPSWWPELSYMVNRQFRKAHFNEALTRRSGIYRFYIQSVLKQKDSTLLYRKGEGLFTNSIPEQSFLPKMSTDKLYNEEQLFQLLKLTESLERCTEKMLEEMLIDMIVAKQIIPF